jgi:hypothetical protein
MPAVLVIERDLARSPTARVWVSALFVYPTGFEFAVIGWRRDGFAAPKNIEEVTAQDRDLRLGLRIGSERLWVPASGELAELVSRGGSVGPDRLEQAIWCQLPSFEHEMELICNWTQEDLVGSLPLDRTALQLAARRASGPR